MADWVILDQARCAGRFWRAPVDFGFARPLAHVPVTLQECVACAANLPLVLDDHAMPWAVLQLDQGKGTGSALITARGQWRGCHVPSVLQTYPFAPDPMGGVLVDAEAMVTDSRDGLSFFNADGQVSDDLAHRIQDVQVLHLAEMRTRAAAAALYGAALLGPPPDARLAPFHGIDTQALAQVGRPTLGKLHGSGALMLAHAVLVSHGQLALLDAAEQALNTAPVAELTTRNSTLQAFLQAVAQDRTNATQVL